MLGPGELTHHSGSTYVKPGCQNGHSKCPGLCLQDIYPSVLGAALGLGRHWGRSGGHSGSALPTERPSTLKDQGQTVPEGGAPAHDLQQPSQGTSPVAEGPGGYLLRVRLVGKSVPLVTIRETKE